VTSAFGGSSNQLSYDLSPQKTRTLDWTSAEKEARMVGLRGLAWA
jgi:hypothetical protein